MPKRFSSYIPPTKVNEELRQALQVVADQKEIALAHAVREANRLYIHTHTND